MKPIVGAVANKATEALKSFIILSMKTMFRRGASGGQIRAFLNTYLPDTPQAYNGQQVIVALEDLEQAGTVERRGIRWCLTAL